jgi:hypothetical protein
VGPGKPKQCISGPRIDRITDGCPNTASESIVVDYIEAILIDQFSAPLSRIEKGRFKNAVDEEKKNLNNPLYIIEYFPKNTSPLTIRNKGTPIVGVSHEGNEAR